MRYDAESFTAGRVSPGLPFPCVVVVTGAIRDEGFEFPAYVK
jgi:hypothetical protein